MTGTTNNFPETLTEALDRIQSSFNVSVNREAHENGWWIIAKKKQNVGKLTIISKTYPLWQQAFTEI